MYVTRHITDISWLWPAIAHVHCCAHLERAMLQVMFTKYITWLSLFCRKRRRKKRRRRKVEQKKKKKKRKDKKLRKPICMMKRPSN